MVSHGIAAGPRRRGRRQEGDVLVWELPFRDFDEGLRFVEHVAREAVDYGRRPDACIFSNRVRLSIRNPHRAGLTLAEMRLAAKVDAVIERHHRGPPS